MACFLVRKEDIHVNLVYELEYVVAIGVVFVVYGRKERIALPIEELLCHIGVSLKNRRNNLVLGYFLALYQPCFPCRLLHYGFRIGY